jgi:hypothetical protein
MCNLFGDVRFTILLNYLLKCIYFLVISRLFDAVKTQNQMLPAAFST